tara:strand:+ start:15644 stop:16009 length:366 start_codon:yes stop_codon:yes gene_type:complete
MEIVNLPLAVSFGGGNKFYSDDVDKPSRFHGLFFEVSARTNNLAVALVTNDFARTFESFSVSDTIWYSSLSRTPTQIEHNTNPIVITFDFPIFSSNGVTLIFFKAKSHLVLPNSVNIFVER